MAIYALNYAHSDTSGASSFPSDSYDLGADYGRASFDIRDRVFLGGTIGLPRGFRLSPFMIFNSGSPYNVTLGGQDLNHDSVLNDRPAFAPNPTGTCVSLTAVCHYNLSPTAADTLVPINYLTGPSNFTLNLRLAKTFGFGPEKAKSDAGSWRRTRRPTSDDGRRTRTRVAAEDGGDQVVLGWAQPATGATA